MPLITQCGRCGRRFTVYAQGLRAHHGRAECPQCGHQFDALTALLDERPDGQAQQAREPLLGTGAADARARLGLPPTGPEAPQARPIRRPLTPLWGLLASLLALGLALQALWWHRAELLRNPATHQGLERLCQRLGCQVPAPRMPGTLSLLDPTLTEGSQADTLVLRLKVRNGAELAQLAPLLELELFDLRGDLTAVRRFDPAEYGGDGDAHLAPGETRAIELTLVTPGGQPAGFKVRLL
jgi:predicted Zn finger-like uncharacterized protein